jgi:hypothetical protein
VQTFVVRVWVPGVEGAGEVPLRGFVTAASSGLTTPFVGASELVGLVSGSARDDAPIAAGRPKASKKEALDDNAAA